MPETETRGLSRRGVKAAALVGGAVGAAALAVAVENIPGAALTPLRWLCEPSALAALLLLLASLAVLVDWLGDAAARAPVWLRIGALVGAVAFYVAFALLATWTAFWPGRLGFASFAVLLPAGDAGELAGRCVIGLGALIAWALTLLLAVSGTYRLATRSLAPEPKD